MSRRDAVFWLVLLALFLAACAWVLLIQAPDPGAGAPGVF
jgi:hypothetical protein